MRVGDVDHGSLIRFDSGIQEHIRVQVLVRMRRIRLFSHLAHLPFLAVKQFGQGLPGKLSGSHDAAPEEQHDQNQQDGEYHHAQAGNSGNIIQDPHPLHAEGIQEGRQDRAGQ
ncbi:hypothetical protein SDC9_200136 [bioreactor metagenome]|uniref:Uncharacterized protein n=1 Tax=bioreactor metagenome TaxID=1076179 RepID=A0A645IVP3_9ZZZZ